MIKIKNYVRVKSLEEAYALRQKKTTVVLGGMLWLKMQRRHVVTAVDLSDLGLNTIEETDEEFRIGCMTTLRQLETHEGLLAYTSGACREAVRHIVGVQFRNLATVGGSLFGRYGFSDVLTFFQAMDTEVELYGAGRIPLEKFAQMKYDRDILVRVIVKKTPLRITYQSVRNTKTDFPVLACCISCINGEWRASIGGRPGRAVLFRKSCDAFDPDQWADEVAEEIILGSNMRASEAYRRQLVRVLIRRCCHSIIDKKEGCSQENSEFACLTSTDEEVKE